MIDDLHCSSSPELGKAGRVRIRILLPSWGVGGG